MSDFQSFINQCWADHDPKTEEIAKDLQENLSLIQEAKHITPYTGIVVHTFGGHLGRWEDGCKILREITSMDCFSDEPVVFRGLATLYFCAGNLDEFAKFKEKARSEGSEVQIHASIAAELLGQGRVTEATKSFNRALEMIPKELAPKSPIARSIAISANNLACELEHKEDRSSEETEFMLSAARAARRYWEIAGTWVELERAEYRMAMSCLKAGELNKALKHARLCESICKDNDAVPFERFYAHEALTLINRALCEDLKSNIKPEFQNYCVIP